MPIGQLVRRIGQGISYAKRRTPDFINSVRGSINMGLTSPKKINKMRSPSLFRTIVRERGTGLRHGAAMAGTLGAVGTAVGYKLGKRKRKQLNGKT